MIDLFEKDTHLHYVAKEYVVVDNPYDDFCPTIVKRSLGAPSEGEISKILAEVKMVLDGEPFYRPDGLWCNRLKANGGKDGTLIGQ